MHWQFALSSLGLGVKVSVSVISRAKTGVSHFLVTVANTSFYSSAGACGEKKCFIL